MRKKEVSILVITLLIELIIGLVYLTNYRDYLDDKYVPDGLREALKIALFDFLLFIPASVSIAIKTKTATFVLIAVIVMQSSGMFLPVPWVSFPSKQLMLSIGCILFILAGLITIRSSPKWQSVVNPHEPKAEDRF
ncbi:hypothetical protein BEL04_20785 [Mucilaginibacter sp. PPCGB 2223]|uniref:hypothetical protein n=1 Tax=Mucilaginibacter sp. PPCGB 2223 TaxID=1886027 RepID=UPI0008248990|nr:hypothetical protein [Mucilaginibacter sp. PPCGB 2223]OCX51147.1 hypothetical protein BEL04_20785 [Mucilaginibacter sp. PPCGB 2223]